MEEAMCCGVCSASQKVAEKEESPNAYVCRGCTEFLRTVKCEIVSCKENQQCTISGPEICVFCHFKKCLNVGLATDKNQFIAHIFIDRMNEDALLFCIREAYRNIILLTKKKVDTDLEEAKNQLPFPYINQVFCPLNLTPHPKGEHIEYYYPIFTSVTKFAKRIPGFDLLSQEDQSKLLLTGGFQVMFVILADIFDTESNTLPCFNGQTIFVDRSVKFLNDLFMTAQKINKLGLLDCETAVLCSFILMNAETPGLKDKHAVSSLQEKLNNVLLELLPQSHPENPGIIDDLGEILTSLTELNQAHTSVLQQTNATSHSWMDLLLLRDDSHSPHSSVSETKDEYGSDNLLQTS